MSLGERYPETTMATAPRTRARSTSKRDNDWLEDWSVSDEDVERRPLPIGLIALIIAVLFVALEVTGVILALDGQNAAATLIGQIVTLGTALPALLGLAAVITGWSRGWGALAVLISVLANPLVLNSVLEWGAGLG